MATQHNFRIKNGLEVAGTERITAAGAGSLTDLTLSGNLTVQGTTVTLDASTLQVADKNIVLNYHASNDTSSASGGAGITIQDAVNGTTDATILWDASDDEFDFSHGVNITNLKVGGAQGTDGQLLTSTGSGVAWEDAPASGPTFKTFGTDSIMIGDSTTGTINNANKNVGLGVDVFANMTSGSNNVAVGFEAGNGITNQGDNVFLGYQAGKSNQYYQSVLIGSGAGKNLVSWRAIAIGYNTMEDNTGYTVGDVAIGYGAMRYKNASFGESIAIGKMTMEGNSNDSSTGNRNICIGSYALQNYTSAFFNITLGNSAGQGITEGDHNILIGDGAGSLITTGSKNIVIGEYNGNESGLDIRTSSNNIILADADANIRMRIDNSGNVGIDETAPLAKLHVVGGRANGTVYNTIIAAGGVNSTDGSGARLILSGCENDPLARGTVIEGISTGTGNSHKLNFKTNNGSNTPTTRMTIGHSGKVGIGYDSPGQKLQIAEATNYAPPGLGSNGGHFGIFKIDSGIPKYGILTGVASSGKVWQQVQRIDGTATAYNLMLQPSGGNIEIGTSTNVGFAGQTAPNTPIHVGTSTSTGPIIQISHENIGGFGSLDIDAYGSATLRLISNFSGSTMNGVATGKFGLVTPHGRDIVFGTSGVERFRISAGKTGIAFNSDTAQANHLDDYEEGTWTPVVKLGTTTVTSTSTGFYTKIGRIITLQAQIVLTNLNSGTGNLTIEGIPFTSANVAHRNHGSVGYYSVASSFGPDGPQARISRNSTFIDIQRSHEISPVQHGHVQVNTELYITITYKNE